MMSPLQLIKKWSLLGLFLIPLLVHAHSPLPQEMYKLLEVCGVEHDGSLESIVKATQVSWLRKAGKERWQLDELDFGQEKNQAVRDLAERLGFIREIKPDKQHYDYCLIGGATSPSFQKRLNYVRSLWKEGLRFDHLVILTGERFLDPVLDKIEKEKGCKTEAEALRLIYETTELPDELRAVPLTIVVAPNHHTPNGIVRPSRADTIKTWLALNPQPGNCMFVTHQPYVLLDHSVIECLLGPDYPFVTVGLGAQAANNSIALLLDTIGRYLFQKLELERQQH